jgi:Short C-terminal domain
LNNAYGPTTPRRKAKVPGTTIVKVGLPAIASVEITSQEVAKRKTGAVLLFGVYGGLAAKGTQDRGAFLVHLHNGQTGYFTIDGFTENQLRGKISPWLNAMGIVLGAPAKAPIGTLAGLSPEAPPTNISDEIVRLAQLKEAGLLTDEEFTAAKAKLLA